MKAIDWQAQRKRSALIRRQDFDRDMRQRFGDLPPMYYDRKNRAVSMERMNRLRYKPHGLTKYARISSTMTRGQHWVSTTWLGNDHSKAMWRNRPVVFETMIFCHHDGADEIRKQTAGRDNKSIEEMADAPRIKCPLDCDTWRYTSQKQALKGHWRVVNQVRHYERGLPSIFDSQEGELDG